MTTVNFKTFTTRASYLKSYPENTIYVLKRWADDNVIEKADVTFWLYIQPVSKKPPKHNKEFLKSTIYVDSFKDNFNLKGLLTEKVFVQFVAIFVDTKHYISVLASVTRRFKHSSS